MSVAWPEKMITQAEAFAKAAQWPVFALPVPDDETGITSDDDIVLRCGECHQSCGQLRRGCIAYNGTLDEMLSMVLRHMVMAHDVPLNTRPRPSQEPMENTPDTAASDGSTHGP